MDDLQQREQRLRQRKTLSDLLIFLIAGLCILVIGGGVGWHYYYGPCGVRPVTAAAKQLNDFRTQFDDAYAVAQATSRIALAGPVANMQEIRRATQQLKMPGCMQKAKTLLVNGMDAAVNAFISFMGESSDSVVSGYIMDSSDYFLQAVDEIDRIAACRPFCRNE